MFLSNLFKKKKVKETLYKAQICGHDTLLKGETHFFGKTTITEMPLNENGLVDYCLDCIGKMAIKCAWCGEPIIIGEPITLYTPTKKDFEVPEYAVIYNEKPLQLVGCLRRDCATSGADRAGFWLPGTDGKGYVHRIPTAYEILLETNAEAVIVNNLSDINEEPRLIN